MADVERERVTALWREAAAAVEAKEHDCEVCELAGELADERTRSQELQAECGRLREQLEEIQTWFQSEPWRGTLDPGSFGGHPYTDTERQLGYGTYRDPRFLPAVLGAEGEQE